MSNCLNKLLLDGLITVDVRRPKEEGIGAYLMIFANGVKIMYNFNKNTNGVKINFDNTVSCLTEEEKKNMPMWNDYPHLMLWINFIDSKKQDMKLKKELEELGYTV
jgi:hypothetical protein